jgi:hypothetical protein
VQATRNPRRNRGNPPSSDILSIINCGTDKHTLFNQNIHAPIGDSSFDNGDFFFTQAAWG